MEKNCCNKYNFKTLAQLIIGIFIIGIISLFIIEGPKHTYEYLVGNNYAMSGCLLFLMMGIVLFLLAYLGCEKCGESYQHLNDWYNVKE